MIWVIEGTSETEREQVEVRLQIQKENRHELDGLA
jgi:hypothetical protein